jgi:hypothetical protein
MTSSKFNTEKSSRRELRDEIEKIKSQLASYKVRLNENGSQRSYNTSVKTMKQIEDIQVDDILDKALRFPELDNIEE